MFMVQIEDMAAGSTGDGIIVTEDLDVLSVSGTS